MKESTTLEDKDVLITGANGFVGSHLVDKLMDVGASVTAFVRSSRKPKLWSQEPEVVRGDVRDLSSIKRAIDGLENGAYIFHFAAQSHVGESWDSPRETLETNILGTLNVLEAVRQSSTEVETVDVAGSSEEYGDLSGDSAIVESDELRPSSIYGTSKLAADFLARNYFEAYGMPVLVTRMFNAYGPRQSRSKITGTVIHQALEGDVISLGDLSPRRDMMFVEDGVRGHLAACLNGDPGQAYNFGSGNSVSMGEWVEKILEVGSDMGHWGEKKIVSDNERLRPGNSEVEDLKSDSTKLKKVSDWEPEIDMSEGIRRTIRWYVDKEEI